MASKCWIAACARDRWSSDGHWRRVVTTTSRSARHCSRRENWTVAILQSSSTFSNNNLRSRSRSSADSECDSKRWRSATHRDSSKRSSCHAAARRCHSSHHRPHHKCKRHCRFPTPPTVCRAPDRHQRRTKRSCPNYWRPSLTAATAATALCAPLGLHILDNTSDNIVEAPAPPEVGDMMDI